VLRQLLTESLLLALAGGVAGMAIASSGIWMVKAFGPRNLPRLQETSVDSHVFLFAFAVTVVAGVLFGLAPALGAAGSNPIESLKEGGQKTSGGSTHTRLRSTLIVSQISLALILAIASGLLVRTFYQLLQADAGFRSEHVLTFELSLPSTQYPDRDTMARFYQQALLRLRSVAGVESAGITESIPMGGATEAGVAYIVGRPLRKGERPRSSTIPSSRPASLRHKEQLFFEAAIYLTPTCFPHHP